MEMAPERRSGVDGAVVVCSGQATLDHVFQVEGSICAGQKHRARDHHQVGGGVAANAAVAIARLGGRAVFVGCVGDDHVGDVVVAELDQEDVDTRYVLRVPGLPTPISSVVVEPDGARTIVNHTADHCFHRQPPAFTLTMPQLGRATAVLDDGRWPAASERSLRLARDAGIAGVVDVDRVPDDPDHRATLFGLGSHLVFSAPALRAFTAIDDPVVALHEASARVAGQMFVTLGERGVLWIDGDDVRSTPAHTVDVVDTTAAGDVFHGAFALALGEGRGAEDSLQFASAAAALKCTAPGGREGAPVRRDVEEFLHARCPEVVR